MIELVDKLRMGGVEVYRSRQPFTENGETWPAGTYVAPFTQVFARYAKDLLEVANVSGRALRFGERHLRRALRCFRLVAGNAVRRARPVFAHEALCRLDLLALDADRAEGELMFWRRSAMGANIRFPYTGARSAMIVNRLLKAGVHVNLVSPRSAAGPISPIRRSRRR